MAPTFPAPQGAASNYMYLFDEPADHAIGRSRGGLSTKIHALVDGKGRPLVLLVAPGQGGDAPMFTHLMDQLKIRRSGPGRPRTASAVTRLTRPGRSGPTSGIAALSLSFRNPQTRSDTDSDVAPPAADCQASTKRTKAATSSKGTSTPSNNGGPWQPATPNSH